VDDAIASVGEAQGVEKAADVLEPQLDAAPLESEELRGGVGVAGWWR
jgi:hypothetical protein